MKKLDKILGGFTKTIDQLEKLIKQNIQEAAFYRQAAAKHTIKASEFDVETSRAENILHKLEAIIE